MRKLDLHCYLKHFLAVGLPGPGARVSSHGQDRDLLDRLNGLVDSDNHCGLTGGLMGHWTVTFGADGRNLAWISRGRVTMTNERQLLAAPLIPKLTGNHQLCYPKDVQKTLFQAEKVKTHKYSNAHR